MYAPILMINDTIYFGQVKFGVDVNDHASVRKIVLSYLEGLYWVLTYYHRYDNYVCMYVCMYVWFVCLSRMYIMLISIYIHYDY